MTSLSDRGSQSDDRGGLTLKSKYFHAHLSIKYIRCIGIQSTHSLHTENIQTSLVMIPAFLSSIALNICYQIYAVIEAESEKAEKFKDWPLGWAWIWVDRIWKRTKEWLGDGEVVGIGIKKRREIIYWHNSKRQNLAYIS